MMRTIDTIDVAESPALEQLVAEAQDSKMPRVLRSHGKIVAILAPILEDAGAGESAAETMEALAAFWRAGGSWKDFDAEKFKRENHEQRQISTRPPVKL